MLQETIKKITDAESEADLDEELFGWITQAYDFAQLK